MQAGARSGSKSRRTVETTPCGNAASGFTQAGAELFGGIDWTVRNFRMADGSEGIGNSLIQKPTLGGSRRSKGPPSPNFAIV